MKKLKTSIFFNMFFIFNIVTHRLRGQIEVKYNINRINGSDLDFDSVVG